MAREGGNWGMNPWHFDSHEQLGQPIGADPVSDLI